jgi:hypothetical protein
MFYLPPSFRLASLHSTCQALAWSGLCCDQGARLRIRLQRTIAWGYENRRHEQLCASEKKKKKKENKGVLKNTNKN